MPLRRLNFLKIVHSNNFTVKDLIAVDLLKKVLFNVLSR